MKIWIIWSAISVLTCASVWADEQVRRVQEELRKRNLYFGDIDGRKSQETTGAIKRYQERKGFSATGELDADTLRSLQLAPPEAAPPTEGNSWPDVAVLKSDAARELAEKDRQLLEKMATTEVPAPVAEPPPTETAPASEPPRGEPPAPQKAGSKPVPAKDQQPPAAERKPTTTEQRPPEPNRVPAASDRVPPASERTPPATDRTPPPPAAEEIGAVVERAEEFVREYLDVAESNKLEAEMAFYADKVNYFDHGTVNRQFIERDVRRYYKRWPDRDYDLLDFKVTKAAGDEVEVKFNIAFRVKNPHHNVAGKTSNTFKIRRNGDDMRFVSLKEQRLRQ